MDHIGDVTDGINYDWNLFYTYVIKISIYLN